MTTFQVMLEKPAATSTTEQQLLIIKVEVSRDDCRARCHSPPDSFEEVNDNGMFVFTDSKAPQRFTPCQANNSCIF